MAGHSERPILGTVCEVCGTLWPDDADDVPDFEPCYCDLSPTPPKTGNRERATKFPFDSGWYYCTALGQEARVTSEDGLKWTIKYR